MSIALAATDAGWIRLCSAQGVHWVPVAVSEAGATLDERCTCLSSPMVVALYPAFAGPVLAASADVPIQSECFSVALISPAQPRAPPIAL